jgi:type IV pilus assembly protein PilM
MPSSNVCWGIEIGAGAIKAVKLEADNQRVNLLDFAYIEHPKVLSTPGIDVNDVLRVSLGQLIGQYDLSKASIAISVPGHSAFARFAKLPPVDPKKVPDIVKFEAIQQVPFPLEEVEWDYQTFQSPDTPEIEVGIFAIKREKVNERLQGLADVGITPDYVTLSPLAAFNALAYDLEFTDKTPGTIIVDVGTTSTDLIICEAGRVWVRTFPIGGHSFTDAIVSTFKVSYPKAEEIKKKAEESQHARQVFQAMRPIFTDLAADISRSIGYYTNLHKDAKLERLIGVGSTFQLPGIRKFLKQQLGLEVYRVEQFKRVSTDALKDEERAKKFNEASVSLATAYGLALQGLGQSAISANLMPVSVIRETMWKGKVKWFGLAAGLAVVASASMFIRPTLDYFATAGNQEPASIRTALTRAAENKEAAAALGLETAATPDYRAANMLALLENRQIHAFLIEDLGQIVQNASEKARGWKLENGSAWPAQDEANPVDLDAAGFVVRKFVTEYRGPGGADPSAPPPDPTAVPGGGLGKIEVTLVVATSRASEADANKFMINTVDAWLKANKERPGVPYRIVPAPGGTSWQRLTVIPLATPEEKKPEGDGGAEIPRPDRPGGGKGPGRGTPIIPGGGDGPSGGGGQGLALAPIDKLAPQRRAPGATFVMQVDWTIELINPNEKKQEPGT